MYFKVLFLNLFKNSLYSIQDADLTLFYFFPKDVYKRQGKSKLMQAYIAYLKNNFENINIIFIDFMDLA